MIRKMGRFLTEGDWWDMPGPLLEGLFFILTPIIVFLMFMTIVMAEYIHTPEIWRLGPITISINQPDFDIETPIDLDFDQI